MNLTSALESTFFDSGKKEDKKEKIKSLNTVHIPKMIDNSFQ